MTKKITRSRLIKNLDSVFSKYIRMKDAVENISTCFTCGKQDDWKKLQNGHFQSRRHYSTRWHEVNCQVQCPGCNVFKQGEQFIFSQNLDSKYGEGTARRLHIEAQKIKKITDNEIKDLINKYKNFVDSM